MRHSTAVAVATDPSSNSENGNNGTSRRPSDIAQKLNDLAQKSGRPLTTAQLAAIIGMSATFIRKEISSGYLRATRIGRGRKPVFRIPLHEARRYVRELGLL